MLNFSTFSVGGCYFFKNCLLKLKYVGIQTSEFVNHLKTNSSLHTLKSLIQEHTGIREQAGVFQEIYKQTGRNKQVGWNVC